MYKPCPLTSANNFTPFLTVPIAPILLSVYMLIGWVGSTRPVLIKCCSHPKFSGSYSILNLKNGRTNEQINGYTKSNGRLVLVMDTHKSDEMDKKEKMDNEYCYF